MSKVYEKCESCGGNYKFDPERGVLLCENCNSQVPIENIPAPEKQFYTLESCPQHLGDNKFNYKCNNCGAPLNSTDIIDTKCPYCHSNSLTSVATSLTHKPDSIIPFAVSKDRAVNIYKEWIRKKKFAPNNLKTKAALENMQGIYYPCWLYDYNTFSTYSGIGVNRETRRDSEGRTYTVERKFPVHGTESNAYYNQIEPANDFIAKYSIEQFEEYSYQPFNAYDPNYLMGFSTLNYERDVHACLASEQMQKNDAIEVGIKRSLGYDYYIGFKCETQYSNVRWSYSLLPIWACNFKYKNKNYNFFVNGKTGNIKGKTPKSGWKIFALVAGIVLGVGAIAALIALL